MTASSPRLLTDDNAGPHVHCRVSGHVLVSPAAASPTACSDPQSGYESSQQLQSDPLPSDVQQLYLAPLDEPRLLSDPVFVHIPIVSVVQNILQCCNETFVSLFVCLGFNGTFGTNRLYRAIAVG